MTIYRTKILDPKQMDWKPTPMLGSPEALDQWCTCPEDQPRERGEFLYASDCPINQLVKPVN